MCSAAGLSMRRPRGAGAGIRQRIGKGGRLRRHGEPTRRRLAATAARAGLPPELQIGGYRDAAPFKTRSITALSSSSFTGLAM